MLYVLQQVVKDLSIGGLDLAHNFIETMLTHKTKSLFLYPDSSKATHVSLLLLPTLTNTRTKRLTKRLTCELFRSRPL